jgi:MarR family transcriptional regulator, lower aerobic nicotinate degradation pathway regulator
MAKRVGRSGVSASALSSQASRPLGNSPLASALNELAQQSLIERSVDPADRRRNTIAITRAGRVMLRRLDKVLKNVQDELLEALSHNDRRHLMRLLDRVLESHTASVDSSDADS